MAATAVEVAQQTVASDPTLVGLVWVVSIMTIMAAISAPLRDLLKRNKESEKEDREMDDKVEAAKASADVTKASAEAILYQHLSEQVTAYRVIADQAYRERNSLVERVATLEAKADALDEARKTMTRMARRLEEQDKQIQSLISHADIERAKFLEILQSKDDQIARRDERISTLEKGQHDLELRLLSDEVRLGCPFHAANTPQPTNPVGA